MIKVIDIDALFDKYIEKFIYDNIGKVKPEEIENKMPILYKEFASVKFKELDNNTPDTFYKAYTVTELLDCLKEHLLKKVSVSDFLCEAIISANGAYEVIVKSFDDEDISKLIYDEYICYLINILNDIKGEIPVSKFLEFALLDYSDAIGELATEALCTTAEKAKEQIISAYNTCEYNKKPRLCDILSNAKADDRIFEILTYEFTLHKENIPLYASFLSKYGDEKALPLLLTAIESDKINFADFEELRFAIEALGGEYNKVRDFSKDKAYKKITGEKNKKII